MGLGQVRDLRQSTIEAIVAERRRSPFAGLRDFLVRVPATSKETTHLIQCGAMDGLADSRVALLKEASEATQGGSAGQLAFGFLTPSTSTTAETAAQRFAWEQRLLGQPVSLTPLDLVDSAGAPPLRSLPRLRARRVEFVAYRLAGWTGGPGIFLSDGQDFVVAHLGRRPGSRWPAWQPRRLSGHWVEDEWGGGRLEVAESAPVGAWAETSG
jgi:hypothetical protein